MSFRQPHHAWRWVGPAKAGHYFSCRRGGMDGYSDLSARDGGIRAARQAGIPQAMADTPTSRRNDAEVGRGVQPGDTEQQRHKGLARDHGARHSDDDAQPGQRHPLAKHERRGCCVVMRPARSARRSRACVPSRCRRAGYTCRLPQASVPQRRNFRTAAARTVGRLQTLAPDRPWWPRAVSVDPCRSPDDARDGWCQCGRVTVCADDQPACVVREAPLLRGHVDRVCGSDRQRRLCHVTNDSDDGEPGP